MPKLARLPAKKVVKKLKRAGFMERHQRGSHLYLVNEDGSKIVTVPMHGADIPIGTLHAIVVHQAGLTIEQFNAL